MFPRLWPSQHFRGSWWWATSLVAVVILGVAGSLILYALVHQWELDSREREFARMAGEYGALLEREVSLELAELMAITRFFESSEQVEPDEFRNFVAPVLELHPGINALEWAPLVSRAQRPEFENELSARSGTRDVLTGLDRLGNLVTAPDNDQFFPTQYLESSNGAPRLPGFDHSSVPARAAALRMAGEIGRPVATEMIPLDPITTDNMGTLVYVPVYDGPADTPEQREQNLRGFVVGHIRIDQLTQGNPYLFSTDQLTWHINDQTATAGQQLIFSDPFNIPARQDRSALEIKVPVNFGGRIWEIRLQPTEAFYLQNRRFESLLILISALLLTIAFAATLATRLREETRIMKLVEDRTHALIESEERFRLLFEYASVGVALMKEDGLMLLTNHAIQNFLGYSGPKLSSKRLRDLAHPADTDNDRPQFERLLAGGISAYTIEKRFIRPDDSVVWGQVSVSAVRDFGGKLIQIIMVIADITRQKQTEQAILDSRSLLEATLESTADGILGISRNRNWLLMNHRFREMWNIPAEWDQQQLRDNLREHIVSMMHEPESFMERVLELEKDLETEAFDILYLKDGRIFERYSIPQYIAGEAVSRVWSYRDVTERRLAEDALRKEQENTKRIIENSLSGFDIVNQDGQFIFANSSYLRMWGYDSLDEILGTSPASHCMDPAMPAVIISKVREEGHGLFEFEARRRDGSSFDVLMSVQIDHDKDGRELYIGHSLDITERKQGEVERERLRSAIEQASDMIIITDADASIQYVNPAFERTTGYTREEVMGENPRILKSETHPPEYYLEMWDTLTSKQTWKARFVNKRKDGSLFTEEATISPVCDADGNIINYVGVKKDITRELQLEEQFRQAQKMDAIGHLTGGVAHDFNNLLQVINGYTEIVLQELQPLSPAHDSLSEVAKAGERAARLVGQLLAFSRRQILHPELIDLNEVTAELTSMLHRVLGERIALSFRESPFNAKVVADRGMLEQVILNLCINSRDAMPAGGNLRIELDNVMVGPEDCEGQDEMEPGRYVVLRVSDTGCGMDPDTLSHIFEPFFTTKDIGKGTGLGLAMVYGIVKQHKGMIRAESRLGAGTTMSVYIPESRLAATAGKKLKTQAAQGGNETILLAEDDPMVRNLTRKILEKARYNVMVAEDGEQAIQIFRSHHEQIDLALLDIVMPRMNGREAYELMRIIKPGLRVLFATGYDDNALESDSTDSSGFDIIQKPYPADKLLKLIRSVLDFSPSSDAS